MVPYTFTKTISNYENNLDGKVIEETLIKRNKSKETYFETKLIWTNIIAITILHVLAAYILIVFPYTKKLKLFMFEFVYGCIAGFGVTAGAHRLWCHKSYKAKLPLRTFLMICYTMSGQNSIFDWVRDHRVHHKYSETTADPHDSNRGLFFSHVGWLMMKKHSQVLHKGKSVDMSDVLNDPVVKFHQRYFTLMKFILSFAIPVLIPYYFMNETLYICFMTNAARYALCLNFTWAVNSFAHIFGYQPYNKSIKPKENLMVSIMALGEGWHNYHHTFPWDYKAGEFGKWNVTAFWIKFFSHIGLAYDLKESSDQLIRNVIEKNGDGTYHQSSKGNCQKIAN